MIKNDEENKAFLKVIEILMDYDVDSMTDQGIALQYLVRQVQTYEKKYDNKIPEKP